VVPLRAGAGTRIKILEALALGKAVVSTSVGCEGLDAVDGRDLLVADDPEEFARRVVHLLRDPGRRRELGAHGRRLVESRYGWDRSADILEAFCARVLERSRAGGERARA
jgi:glycosyltransferase involved in cell wall biosynthesis